MALKVVPSTKVMAVTAEFELINARVLGDLLIMTANIISSIIIIARDYNLNDTNFIQYISFLNIFFQLNLDLDPTFFFLNQIYLDLKSLESFWNDHKNDLLIDFDFWITATQDLLFR